MINFLAESVSKVIYCAKNLIYTKIYSVQKKVRTTVQSRAKMVNTAFATEFKTPCKLGCKCGKVKPVYNGTVDSGHPVYYAH